MNLAKKKELIARTLNVGKNRIKLDPSKLDLINESITRADLRSLVGTAIKIESKKGVSRGRVRKDKAQKKKGRRKGPGKKKGAKYSRMSRKESWMKKVRVQRKFLKELKSKSKISSEVYRKLYNMISGGFFRSKAHLKLYLSKRLKRGE